MPISKHYSSYQELIDYLRNQPDGFNKGKKRPLSLLLGNGFSVNYSPNIFTYRSLASRVEKTGTPLVRKLFSALKTENFELIMEQLDQMIAVLQVMPELEDAAKDLAKAKEDLKLALIDAIKELHPENVNALTDDQIKKCALFLSDFLNSEGKLFTTNYDLLLYWVINRGLDENLRPSDGFTRYVTNPQEVYRNTAPPKKSELLWLSKENQSVFNLHGGLHIFDDKGKIIKETYDKLTGSWLLEKIKSRMDNGHYPIFVTDGNAEKKLQHIRRNRYLSNAYESLRSIKGSLVVFGFSFNENDDHIIEAINSAAGYTENGRIRNSLLSVNIGVYDAAAKEHIESISHKFALKVNTFDSSNAGIWH